MDYRSKIIDELNISGGIVTSEFCRENGIPTIYLSRMQKEGILTKADRGIYISADGDYDELFFFQHRYKKSVYSYETALSLINATDKFCMDLNVTVPSNYKFNQTSEDISVHYVDNEIINLGIIEVRTQFGNIVRSYSYERCLCDMIKNKQKMDPEVYVDTVKGYAGFENKNIENLNYIAEKMNIVDKVRDVMELII